MTVIRSRSATKTENTVEMSEEDSNSGVGIPEQENDTRFSFRKLWAFAGPGFLMSIACLDPGNIDSDLQAGGQAQFKLLWVLLLAHVMCLLLNRFSARLGIVTGKDMAEISREYYPVVPRLIIWVMIEISIICTDMQEVIGTAIAFYLLSNEYIRKQKSCPQFHADYLEFHADYLVITLWVGVLITVLDTITFMTVERCGVRKLEFVFAFLISCMAISFGYEYIVVKPDQGAVIKGIVIPWCEGCDNTQMLLGLSLLGATLQPSNMYLYSALVKSRNIDRKRRHRVSEANMYNFVESTIAIAVSFIINLFVISVFADGLFDKTNEHVREQCDAQPGIPNRAAFPHDNETVDIDVYKAGIFLGCEFSLAAMYIWAIGLLAAGQSSTMTGTYAGQFVMEGFVQIRLPKWQRVLMTRSIAILPTLALVLFANGIDSLTGMNDILNVLQMIQLPFALIPIITFTASSRIMHDFKMSRPVLAIAMIVSVVVNVINIYFIQDYITGQLGTAWYVYAGLGVPAVVYLLFVLYLTMVCLAECELIPVLHFCGMRLRGNFFESDAPWKAQ